MLPQKTFSTIDSRSLSKISFIYIFPSLTLYIYLNNLKMLLIFLFSIFLVLLPVVCHFYWRLLYNSLQRFSFLLVSSF